MNPSSSVRAPIASSASASARDRGRRVRVEVDRQLGDLGLGEPHVEPGGAGDPFGHLARQLEPQLVAHRADRVAHLRGSGGQNIATSASPRFSSSLAVRALSVAEVATISTGHASPSPASIAAR